MIPNYLVSLYTLSLNLSTQGSMCTCEALGVVCTEEGLHPAIEKD
jgi:hypothetical protein